MQKRIDITDGIYILVGDSREVLKSLPEKSVQCGVTSPPYYGPRDYGTDGVLWGGDPDCIHVWKEVYPPGHRSSDTNPGPLQHSGNIGREKVVSKLCTVCGAWLGEIGHEPTPEMYVAHLIEIFREFKRVLRDDGIFWLNIGDSYDDDMNLMEIPSMLAAAMKADGWYERSRLPWLKRNSFPGSTKSRPQSSIEYVFLFSKSCDTLFWVHPEKEAVYEKPLPDYRWLDRTNEEILTEAPYAWEDQILIDSNGEVVFNKSGEPKKRYKRFNLWSGRNYYYDYEAVMQYSSESYNKDKRPRGVIRQCVNPNSKYPDEGQFKKQDNVGNNTYTGFNARYKPNALGLRFMRDSDFFFRTWQGLLHNEEGEPMALIVNPKGYKGAHFACVDTETECLTISGWKRYDQIRDGMEIFTYNMDTGKFELQPVAGMASYHYTGNMVRVFGRSSNMLMTPNHRCVVTAKDKKVKGGRHPAKIVEAANLKGGMKFPVAANLVDGIVKPAYRPEYYELLGWIFSEGFFKDTGSVGISQSLSANPSKCARIDWLLEELDFPYRVENRKRMYNGKETVDCEWHITGWARAKIRQEIPDKFRIPEYFLLLPDDCIAAFLQGFVGGDGHTRPDGRITISQKAKQPLDMVQAMYVRTDKSCILSQRGNGMWTAFVTGAKDRCFKDSNESLVTKEHPYDGLVWCPSVKNGTWVARRGGRPFITGNSFPVKLVEPMIIAGSRPNDIVLDMFGGSCTTGEACLIHGRKFIGIDVKEEYCELGKKRIEDEIKRLKEVDDANRSREEKIPEPVQGDDGPAAGRDAETGGRRESTQQPIAEETGLPGTEVQNHNGTTPGQTDGRTEEATKPVAKRKRKEETGAGIDIHPARPHTRTVADRLQGLSKVSLRDGSATLQRDEPNLTLLEMRTEGNDTDNPGTGMEVLPPMRSGDDQT